MGVPALLIAAALMTAAWGDLLDRESYDDLPGDMELMYPEQNYVDQSPDTSVISSSSSTASSPADQRKYEDPNIRRILMYKMLYALRNRDAAPSYLSVPKWIPSDTVIVPPDMFNYSQLKGPLFKRASPDAFNSHTFLQPDTRLQKKWKNKKPKPGQPIICYFKLCAFRPV